MKQIIQFFFFFWKKRVWLSVVLMWFLAEYKEKFIICQSDDSIYSKLRIFPLFWSHTWNYNIQPNRRSAKVKKKLSIIQFDVFNLSFIFFVPDNKCHKQKWCMLFFTCIQLVMHVLAYACAIAYSKWRRL